MPPASPNPPDSRRRGATRRAFLRALAAALAATGVLPALPPPTGGSRWSAWAARLTLADGYRMAPPHEPRHPFTAVGAIWASGAPAGAGPEVRASADGVTWTAWHALPLDADGAGAPHTSLLFLPSSRLVQYRLPPGCPEPRLILLDSSDGPSLADLRHQAGGGPRLLAAGQTPRDGAGSPGAPPIATPTPAGAAPAATPGPAGAAPAATPGPAGAAPAATPTPARNQPLAPPADRSAAQADTPRGFAEPTPAPAGARMDLAVPRPSVIARAAWGADEARRWWAPEYRVIHHLALHHTGASSGGADPAAAVRSIYHYHTVVLDWGDLGYHYLVDWAGNIYEGRYGGAHVVGGHIRGHNPGVEGIGALGNYDGAWPADGLLQALVGLLAWRCEALGLDPQAASDLDGLLIPNILGHRDAAQTTCPGLRLYVDLPTLRLETRQRLGYAPKLAAEIVAARVASDTAERGERVAVAITVRNTGTLPLPAASPPAGLGYLEGAGALARGLVTPPGAVLLAVGTAEDLEAAERAAAQAQARRLAPDIAGEDAPDPAGDIATRLGAYPYRWGLARDLAPGETTTVTGHLRLRGLGPRRLAAAILREAGDPLAEAPPTLAIDVVPAPGAVRLAVPPDSLAGSGTGPPLTERDATASQPGANAAPVETPTAAPDGAGVPATAPTSVPPALAASRLLLPVLGAADGWTSTVEVRNAGAAPAAVRLRWTPYGGGPAWEDGTLVPPGATGTLPRPDGPALPTGALGAALLTGEGAALVASVHLERADGSAALSYPAPPEGAADLVLPLADLGGLPEQRLLAVQNADTAPARLVIRYQDAEGRELDRTSDVLPGGMARAYRPRLAATDAATIHLQSDGAPIVAALLQTP